MWPTAGKQMCNLQYDYFFLYLDISSSWPGSLWPLWSRDRDFQKAMDPGGPAVCGSPDPAWTNRFYRPESRGSTRSIRPPHSALNWEKDLRMRNFSVYFFQVCMAFSLKQGHFLLLKLCYSIQRDKKWQRPPPTPGSCAVWPSRLFSPSLVGWLGCFLAEFTKSSDWISIKLGGKCRSG